jgi:hypothetical protein
MSQMTRKGKTQEDYYSLEEGGIKYPAVAVIDIID